jgi:hypothetical protein
VANEDTLGTIGGSADIDSAEVDKIFKEAFAQALPEGTKIQEPVVEQPVVETEQKPVVEEKKEPAVTPAPIVAEVVKTEATPPEKTEATPTQVDPNAWLNSLPEDLRAQAKAVLDERDRFKHSADSDRQRVIALNKKSMTLDRELAALRAQIQKPQDPQLAAATVKDSAKSSAEWEQLLGADPTLAKAIESRVNQLVEARENAAIGKFDEVAKQRASQAVAPLQAKSAADHYEQEMQALLKEVPNAQDVFASPQYNKWFNEYASPDIKEKVLHSIDHRTALDALYLYSRDLPKVVNDMVAAGEMEAPPAIQAVAQTEQKPAVVAADTSKADQVAKQREQKLTQAPVVQQAPAAVIPVAQAGIGASVDLDDPGTIALFEQVFKQNSRSR